MHRVDIQHPFWSHFPILKKGAGPGSQPLSGDGLTVKQVSSTHFGPSERLTVDFSDLDNSTLNIVNGQSGNIFDEHYNDQWNAYYNGTHLPVAVLGGRSAAGGSASFEAGAVERG